MSALNPQNPNRGPLTLQHDCTPRDLPQYNPDLDGPASSRLSGDFRLKGWAERDFQSFRDPARRSKEELSLERTRLAGYPVHSNTDRSPESVRSRDQDTHLNSEHHWAENTNNTDTNPNQNPFVRDPYKEKTPAEVAKIQQQMIEADREILKFKQERLQKLREENESKQRDLEQLQSYYPFGKPGGGAPPVDSVKKKKFREEDLTPREEPQYRKPQPIIQADMGDNFADNFGRPGGGAPLKNESGNILTNIIGDPSIRFQGKDDLRQSIENHIRYHKPDQETRQYNHELEHQVEEKKMSSHLQKLEDLKKEIDMLKHNPYGKPGAGAPNRTVSGSQMIGRKNIPVDGPLDKGNPANQQSNGDQYDPWGKGSVQPARRDDGTTLPHRNPISNKYASQIREGREKQNQGTSLDMRSLGGGGAPHVRENGQLVTKLPATMNANDFGQTLIKEEVSGGASKQPHTWEEKPQVYHPFGKPGAGAPRRDEEGRIITTVNSKLVREVSSGNDVRKNRAAQLYHQDLAKGVEEQQRNKKEMENYLKAPIGELASVLKGGQVGKPRRDPVTGMLLPQHLGTSDVTQQKIHDINYRAMADSKHYHDDLTRAAEERYRSRELEKMKERQEAKHHEQVFSDFWGRPGAGAPTTKGNNRKLNLDNTLFSKKQNMHTGDWDYVKSGSDTILTTRSTGYLDNNPEFERYMNSHSRGPIADNTHPQKYVRTTTHSTHANQYDFDSKPKRGERIQYKVDAPWANAL